MARKISTTNGTHVGWRRRLATDIELQDLLFNLAGLVLFIVLPIVAWMWSEGVLEFASVFFIFLMLPLAAWWVMRRVQRRKKRP